jgi:CO/xanthine dehydrogenase Mo-binding subunit
LGGTDGSARAVDRHRPKRLAHLADALGVVAARVSVLAALISHVTYSVLSLRTVQRYLVAADVGRAINPMLVEGQVVGGVVQGLGGTLLEEIVYDDNAQLQTGTFADYMVPSANEAPPIKAIVIENARSPSNPLGVKGVGEVGPSGVAAAIGNAVAHAIGAGCRINMLPLTPERILDATACGGTR